MPTLSIWNSTREGAGIMEPGQWGMKWKFTKNFPEPHTRYSKENSNSFKGKRQSYWVPDSKIIHAQKNVQWLIILFGSLLNQFWSKSCDSGLVRKPRCYSFLHKQVMLPDYVRRSHQSDLSKTSKHWDIFLSHCIAPGVVCWIPCFWAILSVLGFDVIPFINSLVAVGPRMIALKT